MKKKELVTIIEKIVKKEIQKQLSEIFISEETSSNLSEIVTKPSKKQKSTKEIKYSKDEVLNKVLNETKGGIPPEGQEAYPTMGGGTFNTNRMDELMGMNKSDETKREMLAAQTIQSSGKSLDDVPEDVVNALTRDYSDLMKAMDKK